MLVTLVACESATPTRGGDDVDHCAEENLLRKECGLSTRRCEIPVVRCQAECFAGWGCAELEDPSSDPGILACLWSCGPTFACEDGMEIHDAFRCDDIADCLNGEDEEGCVGRPSSDSGSGPVDAGTDAAIGDAGIDAASPDAVRANDTSADVSGTNASSADAPDAHASRANVPDASASEAVAATDVATSDVTGINTDGGGQP